PLHDALPICADEMLAGYVGFPGQRMLSMLEQGNVIGAQRFAYRWSRWPGRSYGRAWQYLAAAALPDTLFHLARRYTGRATAPSGLRAAVLMDADADLQYSRHVPQPEAAVRRFAEGITHSLQRS